MSRPRMLRDDIYEKTINYGTLGELAQKLDRDIKDAEARINELTELYNTKAGTERFTDKPKGKYIILSGGIGPELPVTIMESQPENLAYYIFESLSLYKLEHKKLTAIREELDVLLKNNVSKDTPIMYLSLAGVPSKIVLLPRIRENSR
ncbi:hypothetical protein GCM10007981_02920 [Thermocladium modestius]|uniref:Uncharacterized protein n=1 Tax=Thermocladium modestius TaxID=62609 RepID=A0A830GRB9_9CREN|nr:hypothetical protein [Thermocladium modestius]GGP19398.1 hypothetical protein GCM10007981_02920 [Thermocladium modestius]